MLAWHQLEVPFAAGGCNGCNNKMATNAHNWPGREKLEGRRSQL